MWGMVYEISEPRCLYDRLNQRTTSDDDGWQQT